MTFRGIINKILQYDFASTGFSGVSGLVRDKLDTNKEVTSIHDVISFSFVSSAVHIH